MKWFKRLFKKNPREPEGTNVRPNSEMFGSEFTKFRDPGTSQFFAVTTIRNFHSDYENVYESEWVLVTRVKLEEPKFQQHVKKASDITSMCTNLAKTSRRTEAIVIAKSPSCHCEELNYLNSNKTRSYNVRCSFFRRVRIILSYICRKIHGICTRSVIQEDEEQETFAHTAAGRVRALRGGRSTRGTGAALRAYALHLAQDKSTTFAQNVDNFIACTLDSKETCPQVTMRNMREFMSGMKDYLLEHGEREFEKEVEKERRKLKSTEFLNLDAILEGVMHQLVVRPLRAHLYAQLAAWHAPDLRCLHAAIERAHHATPLQFGIKESEKVPPPAVLSMISKHFLKMQVADSPLDKLENLLAAISIMFNALPGESSLGADDLLPVLAWTVARCRLGRAELEAEFMAGLLPPALLAGEGGYYLTALFSAVAVLKRLAPAVVQNTTSLRRGSADSSDCAVAVVRVALPDECRGSIRRVALPCRPGACAKDLCRALAHAAAITNPQDYALFALYDGQDTMLNENDCPQEVMSEKIGQNFILVYKTIDAKIAWPQQALLSYP